MDEEESEEREKGVKEEKGGREGWGGEGRERKRARGVRNDGESFIELEGRGES